MELYNKTAPEETAPENAIPETADITETASAVPAEAMKTVPEEDGIPLRITVDDGVKRVPIQNKLGDVIGEFVFRPTDVEIVSRFNYMVEHWGEVTDALDRMEDTRDGTIDLTDPDVAAAMRDAKERLFRLCDYAFGGNASEAFFGSMNPFSPIDGTFYCENVLMAVGEFISRYFERETFKINSRMKKYLPTDYLKKGGKRR